VVECKSLVGDFIASLDGPIVQQIVLGDITYSLSMVDKGYMVSFLLCCNNKVWVVLEVN
jgi:hypothetical protein